MNIVKKEKHFFLLVLFSVSLFAILIPKNAFADACTDYNSNFKCTDITTLTLTTGCVSNKCPGNNNNKCCPIDAPVKGNGTLDQSSTNTNFTGGTSFTNPLKFNSVEGLLGGIMGAIQKIVVVLAMVVITIGSVMILLSAGSSGLLEQGKKAITMALVGLAIGFAAPSLLKELAGILGWGAAVPAALTLSQIAVNVLNFLLGTMGIVALVMMVLGAIMYLTAGVDEDMVKKGKDIFKYALMGVMMAMVSMVLVTQVAKFFQ